jgi:hypothetical protein
MTESTPHEGTAPFVLRRPRRRSTARSAAARGRSKVEAAAAAPGRADTRRVCHDCAIRHRAGNRLISVAQRRLAARRRDGVALQRGSTSSVRKRRSCGRRRSWSRGGRAGRPARAARTCRRGRDDPGSASRRPGVSRTGRRRVPGATLRPAPARTWPRASASQLEATRTLAERDAPVGAVSIVLADLPERRVSWHEGSQARRARWC